MFSARDLARELLGRISSSEQALVADVQNRSEWEEMRAARARIAPVPSEEDLSFLLEEAFWSSLTHNERRPTQFALAYLPESLPKESDWPGIPLADPVPLSRHTLRDLAPMHDPHDALLHVFPDPSDGQLLIGGVIRLPSPGQVNGLTVASFRAGYLAVSWTPERLLLVEPGEAFWAGPQAFDKGFAIEMLAKGIGDDFGAAYPTARALLQMGYAIQRAGHGGSLWVLPAGRALPEGLVSVRTLDERGTSLFGSLPLARQGDSVVGNLSGQTQPGFGAPGSLALSESLDALARLASVDGAVLLNMNLNVLGFAAMGQMDVPERLRVWTNVEIQEQAADQLGGGRHRSAYAFGGSAQARCCRRRL